MQNTQQETRGLKQILHRLYLLLDRRQKANFVLILCIMAVSAGLSQLTPKAMGWLTDDILAQERLEFRAVLPVLLFVLAVNVVNELIKIGRRLLVEDTATKTEKKARGLVLASLLKAPLSYFKENMTGNIHGRLNRCLEGTVKLEKLIFMDFAPAIFNSAAAILVIFTTLPVSLAAPMLLVIPIGTAIVLRQIATQKGIRVSLLETKAGMDGAIVELLNGIAVIRITDAAAQEEERFDGRSELLRSKEMHHHVQMAGYDSLKFVNQAVFTVLMIGMSVYLATKGVISAGDVLTAYLCFSQLLKPLEELHRILDELAESVLLAEDFFRLADIPNDFSYQPPLLKASVPEGPAGISLKDLWFSYEPEHPVLRGLELDLQPGTFLGVAGPSGCGKSSLIKALCRLEPYEGRIEIGGADLAGLTRQQIARLVALVPQEPFLIAGSIYENICYGLDRLPTPQEVEQAVQKACLAEFVESLPEKLDTPLAEGGGNLSGGQKQRIAIARVFLRQPRVLILDEATSALDNTTERRIQAEIEQLQKEQQMTVLSIAHRLTTLRNCDRIIVMDQGQIVQSGRFQELVETEGIFRSMYYGRLK